MLQVADEPCLGIGIQLDPRASLAVDFLVEGDVHLRRDKHGIVVVVVAR